MRNWLKVCLIVVLLLAIVVPDVLAGALEERLEQFPQWTSKPSVKAAEGDLIYPEWLAGTWQVTSTLVNQVAPLAPEMITPGFEANRRYLNQSISFQVRFEPKYSLNKRLPIPSLVPIQPPIVADRAFNGLKIAQAYLSDRRISVKVDPDNPNRQITFLPGERQLISTVTGRASESPASGRFIATELSQQVFRGQSQIYLNEVETTTAYHQDSRKITAEQITAIYLSPQDPDYFKTLGRPVAIYRYQLELVKNSSSTAYAGFKE